MMRLSQTYLKECVLTRTKFVWYHR